MTGLRRYVHIAFAVAGLVAAYILSNFFELIGSYLSLTYTVLDVDVASIVAFGIAVLGTFVLWRDERVFGFGVEVAEELRKVTWPTYEETKTATFVVIAMVAVFSVVLGLFDFLWSGVTDALVQMLS